MPAKKTQVQKSYKKNSKQGSKAFEIKNYFIGAFLLGFNS
jgi:hypothetical protein